MPRRKSRPYPAEIKLRELAKKKSTLDGHHRRKAALVNERVAARDIPDRIRSDAETYAFDGAVRNQALPSHPDFEAVWLGEKIAQISKLSRTQYYERISKAYAFYVLVESNPALRPSLTDAAEKLGRKISKQSSPLRLILEFLISYAETDDKKELRRQQKNYSRDVAAILNLIKRGVLPSEVIALSEQTEEGLNNWSRYKSYGDELNVPSKNIIDSNNNHLQVSSRYHKLMISLQSSEESKVETFEIEFEEASQMAGAKKFMRTLIDASFALPTKAIDKKPITDAADSAHTKSEE